MVVVVRPQGIRIASTSESSGLNCFKARVQNMNFLGDVVETQVDIQGSKLTLMLNPYTAISVGQELTLEFPPERCVIVPSEVPSSCGPLK